MFIELSHYTIIFAIVAIGLQAFLLSPTLWSKGSAVAIKLGFRGACFSFFLLSASFLILLYGYPANDFSLAVVFETSDTQTPLFYTLSAFCSSREGYFFTFIIILSFFSLLGFSKQDLVTYQERGRYLFASSFMIFLLLVLMQTTADPFVRIDEPPLEGLGFSPDWLPPYKTLYFLFTASAYSLLLVTYIKIISMHSKGRRFVLPALNSSLAAAALLIGALGIELLTHFTTAEHDPLWLWSPANSLQFAVFLLTAGQIILLFFYLRSRVFTNWILVFSFFGIAFLTSHFFAVEYRLFALSADEVYFPNPVTALCSVTGLLCFFLFFSSAVIRRRLTENTFSVFSREAFAGLAATSLLAAGVCIGGLSLLPTLFMFLPDLPLRLLPALFKAIALGDMAAFTIFFTLAFRRNSLTGGWAPLNLKMTAWFWGTAAVCALICIFTAPNGKEFVLWTLPALLLFWTVLASFELHVPQTFRDFGRTLRATSPYAYGFFFLGMGFLIFSAAFSTAVLNKKEIIQNIKIEETDRLEAFPYRIEKLSPKTEENAAQYRIVSGDSERGTLPGLLRGSPVFQWQDKKLNIRLLQEDTFVITLVQAKQVQEDTLSLHFIRYPALRLIGSALFLMILGLSLTVFSFKKEPA